MRHKYRNILFLTAIAAILVACGTGWGGVKDASSKRNVSASEVDAAKSVSWQDTTDINTRRRLTYFYTEAAKQQSLGNYDAAYTLLMHCRDINPNAPEVHYALSSFDEAVNSKAMSVADIRRAAELQPDNNTYLERLAIVYWESKDYENAIKSYEKLYASNPENTDVLEILFKLYNQTGNYDKMIATIDKMELADGESEKTLLSRLYTYNKQGKTKEEYRALKAFVDKYPNDSYYQIMMANWMLRNKDNKNAFSILQKVLKVDPENASAKLSLVDYYRAENLDSIANLMEEELLLSSKTEEETKASILKNFVARNEKEGGDSVKVLKLFDKILAADPKNANMLEYRAVYLSLKNMPKDSIVAAYKAVLDVAPDNKEARMELVHNLWDTATLDELIAICQPGTEYNPDEMVFYYFLGYAYIQKGDDDKALDTYRKGVAQATVSSDPSFVSDMYSYMGDILHERGQMDDAYAAFDSCLQWKEDNVTCLNNYAYYITQSGGDLAKAEQMSYKTVKAEPTNSTYLDTYAWVLFCEQRYTEAAIYIEQAVVNDTTNSPVQFDHAGDIYIMCGQTDKAIDSWKKAIEAGGDATEIGKKIRLKKYIPSEK